MQTLINEQPASQYRTNGETATFFVTAAGPGALRYQWNKQGGKLTDNSRISGAATPALTIRDVAEADAGEYTVTVSNDCGISTSRNALLTLDLKLQTFTADNTTSQIWGVPNLVLEQAESVNGPWEAVTAATSPFDIVTLDKAKFFRLRMP